MPEVTNNQLHPRPFWDANSRRISSQLWLPPPVIPVDGWKAIGRGWGTCRTWSSDAEVRHELQIPTTVGEDVPPEGLMAEQCQPALKTRRYRLYPTTAEKEILVKWIEAARWTFNECLRVVNDHKDEASRISKKELRAKAINKEAIVSLQKPWLVDTPSAIRDAAMDDLLKAIKAGAARYEKDKKVFKIRYRSRRYCFQESIVIPRKHWQRSRGKYAFLRQMKSAKILPNELPHDSRLVRERQTGHFYLCVPGPLEVVDTTGAEGAPQVVSLDPGSDIGHIYRLCYRLDGLQSRWSKGTVHKKKRQMQKAAALIRRRIKSLVNDLHSRTAHYLCSSYNLVILPKFQTQQMVQIGRRKIQSKTARAMLTLRHFCFQQRLIDKAREYPQCRIVLVSEAHTSKTCGRCGRLNNVGGDKVYRCSHCGFVCDRDVNGARNILVRYCTKIARGESVTD
ncbi:putative transposase DNA-binding domain-containing protein [Lipomyces kononenkoae]|uniref:Transposase DNA-binding domain-containing protein n=1 Tax=Lipomyces kononenkoae TaxID=34357 RepID=A0ACC3TCS8_LIPKO